MLFLIQSLILLFVAVYAGLTQPLSIERSFKCNTLKVLEPVKGIVRCAQTQTLSLMTFSIITLSFFAHLEVRVEMESRSINHADILTHGQILNHKDIYYTAGTYTRLPGQMLYYMD